MDATLGFIMANMGQVKPDSLLFDPFVGTGGWSMHCLTQSQLWCAVEKS